MTAEPTHQPKFMDQGLPASGPVFDKDTLKVGDEVVVIEPITRGTYRARVTDKARVWAGFESLPEPGRGRREWRLRLDNQQDGGQSNYAAFFRTLEQQRYHEAWFEASFFLRGQGIRIENQNSVWSRRQIELARIIWTATH